MIKNNNILKRTKIIATLGPSTDNIEILKNMIFSGVDIVRINFSHANYQDVRNRINMIKKINTKYNLYISILGDLQGPKLRIGEVKENVFIKKNNYLKFTNHKLISDGKEVYLNYTQFAKDVKIGDTILLDDGKIILECIECTHDSVNTKIIQGGELKSNKGVNLPNTKIDLPALTQKDIQDIEFAIKENIDFIALSFVRNSQDITYLKHIIKQYTKKKIPIISKIEKPEAIKNIEDILIHSDAVMIARGDLGVELPLEQLPIIQKDIVNKAIKYKKPVIVATQMLENMINNISPTRAEVNDVANSVIDKADALMLSAETSIGLYPVKVVQQMSKIIIHVENTNNINNIYSKKYEIINNPIHEIIDTDKNLTNNICCSISELAYKTNAKAIFYVAHNNYIPLQLASNRPSAFIIICTNNKSIIPILNLSWGIMIYFYNDNEIINYKDIVHKMIINNDTTRLTNIIIYISHNKKNIYKDYVIKIINI